MSLAASIGELSRLAGCSNCGCGGQEPFPQVMACAKSSDDGSLLEAPENVLSTLRKDGSRRWLRPRLSKGPLWQKRRVVAYFLMAVFLVVPHLRVGGKPWILIDIAAREFTFFGKTFLPTDTLLLALLMLIVVTTIVLITAVSGRVWCGWACPQTVYMEYLFRPIDRLFDGTLGKGGKPRAPLTTTRLILRGIVYTALCMFLANVFLSYFVGTDRLAQWVRQSPIEHPAAFLVMAGTTGLMMFDFLFFREQMCTITCPYGRFQSVMLDSQSKIVTYDLDRGEPRRKGKRQTPEQRAQAGDCVDCNQCVVVCPTGIDIRNGLQMECIHCTQCIDACNSVMQRVGLPTGLIRFSSQDVVAGKPQKFVRPRTLVYPAVLTLLMSGFVFALSNKSTFDARVIRGKGAPFSFDSSMQVLNSFKIRLVNRTDQPQEYQIRVQSPSGVEIELVDDLSVLGANESTLVPIHLRFNRLVTFGDGNEPVQLAITDSQQHERTVSLRILGPRQ